MQPEQPEKKKAPRDFPWCTCCLVSSALFCHLLVLLGNLATSASFKAMGDSTNGWSNVGLDLANTFTTELDVLMTGMTEKLTSVLDKVLDAKEQIDGAFYLIGNITDLAVNASKTSLLEIRASGQDPSALLQDKAALTKALTSHFADKQRRMQEYIDAHGRFGRMPLNHAEAADRLHASINSHTEHLALLQMDGPVHDEDEDVAECTTEEGVTCVFPFVYMGVSHNSCIYQDGKGEAWCATSQKSKHWINSGRVEGEYGACSFGCQAAGKWVVNKEEEAKYEAGDADEEQYVEGWEDSDEPSDELLRSPNDDSANLKEEVHQKQKKSSKHKKTHEKSTVKANKADPEPKEDKSAPATPAPTPAPTPAAKKDDESKTDDKKSDDEKADDKKDAADDKKSEPEVATPSADKPNPAVVIKTVTDLINGGGDWQGLVYDSLKNVTDVAMAFVSVQLDRFFDLIHPALIQIGQWLIKFGAKIQSTIEGFGTTIDKVQKIIDAVMSAIAGTKGKAQVEYDTYTLYDMAGSGYITTDDLKLVGKSYGIQALDGDKAGTLLKKYDQNKDDKLDKTEYSRFVEDDSIPGCMCVVLRAFSKKLAQIAGNVKAARLRDEVAKAVAEYLTHISAKNKTKVQWVSDRLTNASIPMAFTADLMKQLSQKLDDPEKLSNVDVGQLVITEMTILKPQYVSDSLKLMSDPKFWESEGFDPSDQPKAVERVTKWVTAAAKEVKDATALNHLFGERGMAAAEGVSFQELEMLLDHMPMLARETVAAKAHQYRMTKRAMHAAKINAFKSSDTAKMLFDMFLGGSPASAKNDDPTATATLNSGVMAVPETLEFALFLHNNASATAKRFQDQCMEYMGDSSSALDSFANQIQAMTKKMTNFLTMMKSYSTPTGIKKLEDQIKDFAKDAAKGILDVVDKKILQPLRDSSANGKGTLLLGMPSSGKAVAPDPASLTQVFTVMNTVLTALQGALPSVIDDLKFARKEVSAVSSQLKNIFGMVKVKGPPVFDLVAQLYSVLWIVYFIFFGGITLGLLFYGFWSSGYFGGPDATANTEYEPPVTMRERCAACWRSCKTCMNDCHDTQLCFWSCILVMEIIVLVLFVVAIILTLLAGIKAFINAGCSQVYLLGDPTICTGILSTVQSFLGKFWTGKPVGDVCGTEKLMTCQIIAGQMKKSIIYTTGGSMVAAVLSFQMVIQSAILHEQARWRRIADEFEKA